MGAGGAASGEASGEADQTSTAISERFSTAHVDPGPGCHASRSRSPEALVPKTLSVPAPEAWLVRRPVGTLSSGVEEGSKREIAQVPPKDGTHQ